MSASGRHRSAAARSDIAQQGQPNRWGATYRARGTETGHGAVTTHCARTVSECSTAR